MNLTEIRERLAALDIVPSRKLGQNFLHDQNMVDCLLTTAAVGSDDLVVEIGPGLGALTTSLAETAGELLAVEYDVRLAEVLTTQFESNERVTVVQADAARFDFDAYTRNRPWICIANLPYSVSTVILGRFLDLTNPPQRQQLLLQKEMATRLSASPGNKKYGSLTVRIQSLYTVELVRTVAPTVFWPAPEVQSAVVTMTAKAPPGPLQRRPLVAAVVRKAFSQRRKRAMKLLRSQWPRAGVEAGFAAAGLDRNARAEEISVKQYWLLAAALDTDGNG